jgi:TolB-like protein
MSIGPIKGSPTPSQILEAVSRILTSADFIASVQLTRFLRYIVETSLAGHEDQIKERTVAMRALERDADFDPRLDPIVRMVAGKLRRALERFYADEGADVPVRIDIPKGGYRPVFIATASNVAVSVPADQSAVKSPLNDVSVKTRPVVAVIPFVTFTQGSQERLLADSIAQDVCVGLSKVTWFEVIDYLVARSHCNRRFVPIEVASRLHADFCVTGTVRRLGESLRATVQLTDTCCGVVAWADAFVFPTVLKDAGMFEPVVQRIVAKIGDIFGVLATIVWDRAKRKSVHQLSACEAVLANLQYQSNLDDDIYPDALHAANHALTVDPGFAWGWAAMATLHLDAFSFVAKRGAPDADGRSMECIRRALEADPTSAFACWTMGLHHLMHGRPEETVVAANLAVEYAQGSPFELGAAGAIMSAAGDHDQGQDLIDRALELNPGLPGWIHWGTAINALKCGERDRGLAAIRMFSLPNCFWDHVLRAAAFLQAGNLEQSRLAAKRVHELRPEIDQRPREFVARVVQESDLQELILDSLRVN